VQQGDKVFSGMVNLSAPLKIKITAVGAESLLGSMLELMEQAEQGHARYVRLADRIAAYYTPVVHVLALGTFLVWWLVMQSGWQPALLTAMTVLIITCPCALGLAVPVVQVLASSRLFKQGLLLKAADALERLAQVDVIVFDKTGSLTVGKPKLVNGDDISAETLIIAASVALHSRHPLARALVHHCKGVDLDIVASVTEYAGVGMAAIWQGQSVRLGRRDWCGDKMAPADDYAELWLQVGETKPVRFVFADKVRVDAAETCAAMRRLGYNLYMLSGDRPQVVSVVAEQLGITQWHAGVAPVGKADFIRSLQAAGHKVLMVGDGMNDAPALTVADVSLSPSTALDIAQNAADIVFQGERLAPVLQALQVSKRTQSLVLQNFLLALLYNMIAIPLAMLGYVTPLVAAVAMASSSVLVVLNAQRILIGRNGL
jgi:Cu2+-exporting ATPase